METLVLGEAFRNGRSDSFLAGSWLCGGAPAAQHVIVKCPLLMNICRLNICCDHLLIRILAHLFLPLLLLHDEVQF